MNGKDNCPSKGRVSGKPRERLGGHIPLFFPLCLCVSVAMTGCVTKQAIDLAQKNQRVVSAHAKAACDLGEDTTFAALSTEIKLAMAEYSLETYRNPNMTPQEREKLWQSTNDRIQKQVELVRKILREGWTRLREQFGFAHEAATLDLVAWGGMEGLLATIIKGAGEGIEEIGDWCNYQKLATEAQRPQSDQSGGKNK